MTTVTVEVELSDLETGDLERELRRRRSEVFREVGREPIQQAIALLELGRWREALDTLKIAMRNGSPMTEKERAAIYARYEAAMVA